MKRQTEFDCPHPLCDSRVTRIKGKKGQLYLCKACDKEGRNKYIPSVDGKPAFVMLCPQVGCTGWAVRLLNKEKKKHFFFCNECKEGGRNPYYDDKDGCPHTDRPVGRLTAPCPHDGCKGMAQQYTKTKVGTKFWICKVCEKAGRDKFYKDEDYRPVI